MKKLHVKKIIFILLCLPIVVFAEVASWRIIPNQSSLTFTAIQNGAPVTGQFTNFSGNIHFDPAQLGQSNMRIIIDVGSISDAYHQLSDTLKSADWFNTKMFPRAIFQSSKFIKTGDKTYRVEGMLTIKNKTQPIVLNFTENEYSQTKAKMTGNAMIKRTAFGIGQGEWADTKTVKDEVEVKFIVNAVRE